MAATLKLIRYWPFEKQNVVGRHPYEIVLDGTVVGTVPAEETAELPIDSGHHTLRLKSGRRVSRERSFDATDGQTISFSCHGPFGPIFLASFIKPDLAISPQAAQELKQTARTLETWATPRTTLVLPIQCGLTP